MKNYVSILSLVALLGCQKDIEKKNNDNFPPPRIEDWRDEVMFREYETIINNIEIHKGIIEYSLPLYQDCYHNHKNTKCPDFNQWLTVPLPQIDKFIGLLPRDYDHETQLLTFRFNGYSRGGVELPLPQEEPRCPFEEKFSLLPSEHCTLSIGSNLITVKYLSADEELLRVAIDGKRATFKRR